MSRDPELERLIAAVGRQNNFWCVVRWAVAGVLVIWCLLG